jgi:hypothetical protein
MNINDLMSAIEFGPDPLPEEFAQDNENSMAEIFDFESPAAIFSSLSELKFTPEPMEDLEALERDRTELDDSPETDAEELSLSFVGSQFFDAPFLTALNGELPLLMAEDEDPAMEGDGETKTPSPEEAEAGEVISERDGVAYISENTLAPDEKTLAGLNRDFKDLIDSVLNDT